MPQADLRTRGLVFSDSSIHLRVLRIPHALIIFCTQTGGKAELVNLFFNL
uniref:Uncharacterized protein n=1 Tax=Pseudomonas putida TaxID=303 RepID=A0A6B7Q418_PSEPU|nr:hypothetical protein [Pseudomonas putida]